MDKGADRTDSAAVFMDDGTRLTDKRARISDSAAEFLDYGAQGTPRRAGFTHGNFGFGVRFLLDDAHQATNGSQQDGFQSADQNAKPRNGTRR